MKSFTEVAWTMAAAAVLMAGSSVARAEEVDRTAGYDRTPAETVSASDLDLTSAADVETLYQRIRSAAISACRADAAAWDVKRVLHRRQCVDSAVDQAVSRLDVPLLSAMNVQRSPVAGR
jgi:UrcA family protein